MKLVHDCWLDFLTSWPNDFQYPARSINRILIQSTWQRSRDY